MCSIVHDASDGNAADRLGREITELAAHIHAATCRWLELVAEFDRRRAWAQWGCKSCAQFLSWRCAIAPGAAREQVRVARRLEALPLIKAAFAQGRLSYSKARALTRVGEVEHEETLLDLARHSTAAQLERMVRAYRGVVARDRAAAGRPARFVTWEHDDDGSLLLRARLPAEEGALVLAALDAAERQIHGIPSGVSDVAEGVSAETLPAAGERRVDALLAMSDAMLAGAAATDRSGGDRHQIVVHVDTAALADDPDAGSSELADGSPLGSETARRLACDAAIVPLFERNGRPLSVGRKTRSVPAALRRALSSRDRGCRFPGCTSRSFVDAHHVVHWAQGGATRLDNLVQLCRHHHRLVHEGGFSVQRAGPDFVFRGPDGRRLRRIPRPPRGRLSALREGNRGRMGPIRPDACVPESVTPMDLGLCVDALLRCAPSEAPGI
jgi:hypothetical protein